MKFLITLYEKYWSFFHFVRHYEWSIIRRWLDIQKGQRICDLACGGGIFSKKLAEKGIFVDGIDIDRKVIDLARIHNNHKNCTFHVGKAEKMPFTDGQFDSVFSICSFQHFENELQAFKSIGRVLRKGGFLVFSADSYTFHGISMDQKKVHAGKEGVRRYYDVDGARKILETAGFALVRKKYILNSVPSHWIMRLWDQFDHHIVFLLLFPVIYPFVRISDLLFGRKGEGYIIVIKAQKQ